MSKSTSVVLSAHFEDFVGAQVATGRYGSASEVVRAGLRLLEEREAELTALRAALIEGEQSGVSDRTIEEIVADARARTRREDG